MATERKFLAEVRRAFADYRYAEGCSCCRNNDEHAEATERLGKLLKVPRYPDHSGRNFTKFRTKKPRKANG